VTCFSCARAFRHDDPRLPEAVRSGTLRKEAPVPVAATRAARSSRRLHDSGKGVHTRAGNDTYGAWREERNDLLLAVAMACWIAEEP